MNRAIIAGSVIVGIVVMLSTSTIPPSYGGSGQTWLVTFTNENSEKSLSFSHNSLGNCTGGGDTCKLPLDNELEKNQFRKCINTADKRVLFNLETNPVIIDCKGPWTIKLDHEGITDFGFTHAAIVF